MPTDEEIYREERIRHQARRNFERDNPAVPKHEKIAFLLGAVLGSPVIYFLYHLARMVYDYSVGK